MTQPPDNQAPEVVAGRHAVEAALEAEPHRAQELLYCVSGRSASVGRILGAARAAGVRLRRVDRETLDRLAGGASHQGVALKMAEAGYAPFDQVLEAARAAGQRALVVVADHLQDPHNLGAVVRSAAAAGAQGVVIPKDRACPLTAAAAKAAAGALALVPVARVTNLSQALDDLRAAGLWLLAAAAHQGPAPWDLDLDRPLALVVGGEHKGVGPRVLGQCDLIASLPLGPGVESLNASVAAGVILFEIVRQRAVGGK